jgi:hypothetical protein
MKFITLFTVESLKFITLFTELDHAIHDQHIQKKHMYPSLEVDQSQKKHMCQKPEAHHKYNFQNIFHRRMVFQYVYFKSASSIYVYLAF